MTDFVLETLKLYLDGQIDLVTLEDRIIPLAWNADCDGRDIIDQIAIEMAYVRDNVSDEDLFKARVSKLGAPKPKRIHALADA